MVLKDQQKPIHPPLMEAGVFWGLMIKGGEAACTSNRERRVIHYLGKPPAVTRRYLYALALTRNRA